MSLTFHANGRIEGSGSTTPYVVGSICQTKKFSITAPSTINNGIRSQSYPTGIKCSITPISTNPKILIATFICFTGQNRNIVYTLRDNTTGTFIQFNPDGSPTDPGIGSVPNTTRKKITSGTTGSSGYSAGDDYGVSARTYVGMYTPPNNSTREIEAYIMNVNGNGNIYIGRNESSDGSDYDSFSPCEITLMEIAG